MCPLRSTAGLLKATELMTDSRGIPFLVSAQPDLHGDSSWKLVRHW